MTRILIFALLGPPLGALTGFLVLLPIVSLLAGDTAGISIEHLRAVPAALPPAYFIGIVPAILVGICDAFLSARNVGWRPLWCGLFGFAVSFVPLAAALSLGFLNGPFVLLFGVVGAVPGAVCSWVSGRLIRDGRVV